MGILKFLNKNKNKEKNFRNLQQNEQMYDIQYFSKLAGCDMNINISDEIIEINGKILAKGIVMYGRSRINTNEAQVLANEIYMEPSLSTLENGEVINTTRAYYQQLFQNNPSMCKAFFRKQDIQASPTKYIGALGVTSTGEFNGTRYKDENFERAYIEILHRESEQRKNDANNRFREELQSKIYSQNNEGYQQMCNNFDRKMEAIQNQRNNNQQIK